MIANIVVTADRAGDAVKVICFVNQKGGVGKTASVVNIGAGLVQHGQRVLLVDLDPQESLSYWLGIDPSAGSIYEVLTGTRSLVDCIASHDSGLEVLPASEMLATLTPDVDVLRDLLRGLAYDYILLDCSPTLGMITLAALTAADWVIVPLCPDLLSLKGMSQLLGTVTTVREQTNAELQVRAIVATRYSLHKRMHREVLGQIKEFFASVPVYTVRENVAVAESPVAGQSVLAYRPQSTGARDYMAIAEELINGKSGF